LETTKPDFKSLNVDLLFLKVGFAIGDGKVLTEKWTAPNRHIIFKFEGN